MIKIPRHITRTFIQKHPELTFVYSQDVARKGAFGQAAHCVSEPNCYPVSTCWKMCRSSAYFQDSQACEILRQLTLDLKNVPRDKPIILFPKIGEGFSRMKEFAPNMYQWLMNQLDTIKSKDYEFDYSSQ